MLGADKQTFVCVNLVLTGSTNWTTVNILGVSSPMTTSDCDRFIPGFLSAHDFDKQIVTGIDQMKIKSMAEEYLQTRGITDSNSTISIP